jgi:AcrR family transcriptional regulator
MSVQNGSPPVRIRSGSRATGPPPLLARVAEVLVADPAASLAQVAQATGIGRTTLHNHYATRQDLLVAVANSALDRCAEALTAAIETAPEDRTSPTSPTTSDVAPEPGGQADPLAPVRAVVTGLVPVGAQLAFLFRQPSLDAVPAIGQRQRTELDEPILVLIQAARSAGALRADQPDWWQISSLYALVYVAWEGVAHGLLAPVDAPQVVLATLLAGVQHAERSSS